MIEDEKQITIRDEEGNEHLMEILFTYEHDERKKKYVFLYNKETPEEQLDSMKQMTNNMNYMMPIMSISISLIAPLGLSLYWLISNILQLGEKIVIDKVMNNKKQEEIKDV